jgi:cation transport regulator ChaB
MPRTTSFHRQSAAICHGRRLDIYREAFNHAWQTYGNEPRREEIAHRVAWAAVKHRYEKGKDGNWHARE